MPSKLDILNAEIVACELCPRLRRHCLAVAQIKRRAYQDWDYWGLPVPGFGDPRARVLVIGLAPGAHGANRTGRMFTGDRSGEFLYRALYETGFASQPDSLSAGDGLQLSDLYITASARCAPPGNKPERDELARCRPYLERELELLRGVRVVVTLGAIGWHSYLSILRDRGVIPSLARYKFGHAAEYRIAPGLPLLLGSYHPSQQNTSTGKLTRAMLQDVFARARQLADAEP